MSIEQFQQMGYKTESVELTAETLVAADFDTFWDFCLIKPASTILERRPRRLSFSAVQPVGGAFMAEVSGVFEPRPSGADATPPDWYQIAKAAGATITGDVAAWGAESAASDIIGTACTFKYRDGVHEHISAGTRVAMMRFSAKAGDRWMCEIGGSGRYSRSTEAMFVSGAQPSAGAGLPFLGLTVSIAGFTGAYAEAEISIDGAVTLKEDGSHASGKGASRITGQACRGRFVVEHNGTVDWHSIARNDGAGDVLAVSCQMSAGSAGNVLTWTGNLALTEDVVTEYREGIGYSTVVGEFITTGAGACLTLTQS